MENVVDQIVGMLRSEAAKASDLKNSLSKVDSWKSITGIITNIRSVSTFISNVVIAIETMSKTIGACTSDDKLEAATTYISSIVKFSNPIINWMVKPVIKIVVSIIVDMFNRETKNWDVSTLTEKMNV